MGILRSVLIGSAGVVLAVGAVGCGEQAASEPETFDVTINIKADTSGTGCYQSPISGTERLVMKDGNGTIVASEDIPFRMGRDPACDWTVTLTGVPVSDFYTLENGTDPAGPFVTLTYDDISDGDLKLQANYRGVTSVAG